MPVDHDVAGPAEGAGRIARRVDAGAEAVAAGELADAEAVHVLGGLALDGVAVHLAAADLVERLGHRSDGAQGVVGPVAVARAEHILCAYVVVPLDVDRRPQHLADEVISGGQVLVDAVLLLLGGRAATPGAEVPAVAEVDAQRRAPAADEGREGVLRLAVDEVAVIVAGRDPFYDAHRGFFGGEYLATRASRCFRQASRSPSSFSITSTPLRRIRK